MLLKDISYILAFSAGLLSFLSPCVLPLVPAYVSYLTGITIEDMSSNKRRLVILYKSIGFVLGFSIIFIVMGASITSIGKMFIKNQNMFRKIGGFLIILFGLHIIGLLKFKWFYREIKFISFDFRKIQGKFGSIFMGMAFAAGWTPCVGPILSSILIYASSMETVGKGIILLIFYSLGLAIPFILTALAIGNFSEKIRSIFKYFPYLSKLSGALMIIMGIMIFTNKMSILSRYLNFINFY